MVGQRVALRAATASCVLMVILYLAGCGGSGGDGGSALSIEETRSCFESAGYTTADRPDLGFADVGADDWYEVADSAGEDVVAVAYFEDSDSVDRAKRVLAGITKTMSEGFGVEVTDADIDDLVRTSGHYLYWWNGSTATHEDDVENCVNP